MLKSLKHLLSVALVLSCGYANAFIEAAKIQSFDSKVMGQTRQYSVRLPQAYTAGSNLKYPVLYIFDGLTNLAHTSGTHDFLTSANEMPKVIIVAVNTNTNTATRALDLTPAFGLLSTTPATFTRIARRIGH
jgi:predicted alpha/beta superfamily hydrolase